MFYTLIFSLNQFFERFEAGTQMNETQKAKYTRIRIWIYLLITFEIFRFISVLYLRLVGPGKTGLNLLFNNIYWGILSPTLDCAQCISFLALLAF